ncbi:MAG: DUF883 family protein [Victivallales bacterium]|nr:DUF883 family protein [Victivallales bacterium]
MANKTAGDKLDTALKSANEAVKELKKMGENTKIALTEDLKALKDALGDTNVAHRIVDAKDYSVAKAREAGEMMDESVRQKPYHYIAGAAVLGLLLGVLIGRKS